MRALYIIGILLSIVFAIVTLYFAEVYLQLSLSFTKYHGNENDGVLDSIQINMNKIAATWMFVSLLFFIYFIVMDIIGLVRIKRKITKVLSVMGLLITGIMLSWAIVVISLTWKISVLEVVGMYLIYALLYFVFSIAGLIQAVKWRNQNYIKTDESVLDDLLKT